MKANIHTFQQVLYSPCQYVIPVFQRNYRWELPQWQRLWDSLEELQKAGKTGNHFMGFLVYVVDGTPSPSQATRFHLIDGQQRLTTLSLLLIALRNVARRLSQTELADEVHEDYLTHRRSRGDEHYRLLPKEHDHDAYLALVDEEPSIPGRMSQAVAFFERKLTQKIDVEPQALQIVFDVMRRRLDFMGASLESENAYSIFKSLNSTGVPLSQADLIRNFVFMHVTPEEQDAFDAKYWRPLESRFPGEDGRLDEEHFARFFRDLLMSEGQYVPPKQTFTSFESRYEATGFKPAELAKALLKKATQYSVIAGQTPDENTAVTRALAGLNQLESSTTFPLLLWLFSLRDERRIDSGALARAIDMLRGFVLRRFVCGESSRGYGEMFVRPIRMDVDDPVALLEGFLLERGWPHDARFVESFVRFPLYKRAYARDVLATLESARGHKEQASLERAQIEHILPQTLSEEWAEALGDDAEQIQAEWLHQPGNLTLSGYNPELGNQPFATKQERFKDSNIGITRELADYPRWTEAEIMERGERLGREALAIWPGPIEAYAAAEDEGVEREAKADRLAFWSGLADHLAEAFPDLPEIEPEPKRALRLASGVPYVRLSLRFKVQDGSASIILRFKRRTREAWRQLHDEPALANGWVGQDWEFSESDDPDGSMTLSYSPASKDPALWPALHDWLGSMLSRVHQHALPWIGEMLGSSPADDDEDAGALTPTRDRQLRYWHFINEEVIRQSPIVRPQKPLPQHWLNIAIGRTGFVILPTVNKRLERLGVELSVGSDRSKQHFRELLALKEQIERDLGFELDWQELPNAHVCRIATWRLDCPLQDESRWPDYADWMVDRIIRMDAVLRPLIKGLS